MLKHILTIIKNNFRSNLVLVGGMFVIATSLWYAVDYVYAVVVNQQKELGFDWQHTYYVQVGVLPEESEERDTTRRTDDEATEDYLDFYNRIQKHSAVESACYTYMHFHYIWKNGTTQLARDTFRVNPYIRLVSPSYFKVFRVKGVDGASPEEMARRAAHTNELVVTDNTARNLLAGDGDGNPSVKGIDVVGKWVFCGSKFSESQPDTVRIAAVCENQKYNEYTSQQSAAYLIRSLGQAGFEVGYGNIPYFDMFIRVKPDADVNEADFIRSFRREMKKQLRVGNLYLADMRPMGHFRNEQLADYRSELNMYLAIAGFFLTNAFLAVLGTFWFRTQQRREELAVRLAMGATPHRILTLLMGEGLVLITIAFLPATIVLYNLGYADLVETWPVEWSTLRFILGGLMTYLLLLVIVMISIWFPARGAMKIEPAEALHGE